MPARILAKSDSHDGLRSKLQDAITAKHGNGSKYSYMGDASVHDVFPGQVVHSVANKDGIFASPYSQDNSGAVKLGEPKKVEPAYKPLSEAFQGFMGEALNFTEAAYDKATGRLRVTVIKPGFNTSKTRYYPATTLKRDHKIFEGAKMFKNHQTVAEARARPEGNVDDWVADLTETSIAPDGSIVGVAQVHDAPFKEKLAGLQEAGLLGNMGISIRAAGEQQEAEVDKTRTMWVESFTKAKSVDFVTFPGAGGQVLMMESEADDIDYITVERLAIVRPDLVKHFTEVAQEASNMAKTLQELEIELTESNRQLAEERNVNKRITVAAKLTSLLTEAKLPTAAENRIKAQFKEATEDAGIAEAIASERTYIAELGVIKGPQARSGVRNMGESVTTATASTVGEKDKRDRNVAAWKKTGMSQEAAELAADNICG